MSENYENILVEKHGNIGILTINRPNKLNALNSKVHSEGVAALKTLKADAEVRVVIIKGAGEKAFVAGADISEFSGATPVEQRATMNAESLFTVLDSFPKPIIAMINGFCLGGGNELAMACDLRVASDKSKFGQPEINLGIIPGGGGTQRLTNLIGESKAMEIMLTGEMIDAQTAFNYGLVNYLYPPEELEAKTLELAGKIAEKSPIALQMVKEAVKFASKSNLDEGLRREIDLFALCFSTEDKQEGVNAFLEKRKPVFTGK